MGARVCTPGDVMSTAGECVLDFSEPVARMFAITTDEAATGFADFLFLTGALTSP